MYELELCEKRMIPWPQKMGHPQFLHSHPSHQTRSQPIFFHIWHLFLSIGHQCISTPQNIWSFPSCGLLKLALLVLPSRKLQDPSFKKHYILFPLSLWLHSWIVKSTNSYFSFPQPPLNTCPLPFSLKAQTALDFLFLHPATPFAAPSPH